MLYDNSLVVSELPSGTEREFGNRPVGAYASNLRLSDAGEVQGRKAGMFEFQALCRTWWDSKAATAHHAEPRNLRQDFFRN